MYSIRTSSSKPSSSMTFLAIQGFMTAISTLRMSTFVSNEGGNCVLRIRAACLSLNRGSWSRLVPRKKFPAIVCSPRLDSSRLVQVTRARGE